MSRDFGDQSLGSLELFCLTAELESFTGAAAAAGLTPPAVSRTIARLEARLGARLFARTTRKVRLTEAGRSYFEQCKQALGQLAEAERQLTGEQTQPSGKVRVSLPTSYGHSRVLPLVAEFSARYPEIQLELQLSNRNIDFTEEGYDLAVRVRTPPELELVARKLEDAALVVVASPDYLRRHGEPQTLDALDQHNCIQFILPSTGQTVPWLFRVNGRDTERQLRGSLSCTDDIVAPVTLARHGAGVAQTYRFMVANELASGTLQELLTTYAGASRPFYLLYPRARHMPRRVRVLIDFLMEKLGEA